MTETREAGWRKIESAPRDGTIIRLGHSQAVNGSDCTGKWVGDRWVTPHAFLTHDMRIFMQPDQWRYLPTPPQGGEAPTLTPGLSHD